MINNIPVGSLNISTARVISSLSADEQITQHMISHSLSFVVQCVLTLQQDGSGPLMWSSLGGVCVLVFSSSVWLETDFMSVQCTVAVVA